MSQKIPVVLTLSGHDPSGGAGIQADIETLAALNCHTCGVITALTTQNTQNVLAVYPQNPSQFAEQLETLWNDLPIGTIKIGLVGSIDVALAIADWLMQHPKIPTVFDPVLAAGGGARLVDPALLQIIKERLLPITTVLTPNSLEAVLLNAGEKNLDLCGRNLLASGCQNVLITGTHENEPTVKNRLYLANGERKLIPWERLPDSYHGSGCTLAASIAGYMALGLELESAIDKAQDFTWQSLKAGYKPGTGQFIPNRRPAFIQQ